ncbi:hypothetical protein ABT071_38795 [Streptomyces sp. NPDC002506]|uniref:hypothetical protein n=1 Tax=Streptomyces sp. NPDC002506 TaxID=3154536 RepID=UPI00332DB719
MATAGLRKISKAVLIVLVACGCSMSSSKKSESGPTYQQAMEALYPDVLSAMRATMPGIRPDEYSGGTENCGGSEWLDSKDASKRTISSYISLPGAPSDKRTPASLVDGVLQQLRVHGWTEDTHRPSNVPGNEVTKYAKKQGGNGIVVISASPFKTASGDRIQTLVAQVVTDCLRNPDYNKS